MEIKKEDLPVMLQAFEVHNNSETFVAEQLVNSQVEVDRFTGLYAGKIIKANRDAVRARNNGTVSNATTDTRKRNSATGMIMIIIVLVLLALVIYGFSTGWIQEKFNLKV